MAKLHTMRLWGLLLPLKFSCNICKREKEKFVFADALHFFSMVQ